MGADAAVCDVFSSDYWLHDTCSWIMVSNDQTEGRDGQLGSNSTEKAEEMYPATPVNKSQFSEICSR